MPKLIREERVFSDLVSQGHNNPIVIPHSSNPSSEISALKELLETIGDLISEASSHFGDLISLDRGSEGRPSTLSVKNNRGNENFPGLGSIKISKSYSGKLSNPVHSISLEDFRIGYKYTLSKMKKGEWTLMVSTLDKRSGTTREVTNTCGDDGCKEFNPKNKPAGIRKKKRN